MKILHLTLKKKWFDMIASGEKKEEYREVKMYWVKRLVDKMFTSVEDFNLWVIFPPDNVSLHHVINKFDAVQFKNGYAKDAPTITLKWEGTEIGKAKPEWSDNWQGDVFVIKLGEIINPAPAGSGE